MGSCAADHFALRHEQFYASVELLQYPELRRKPVAVCGDPTSRHGIIFSQKRGCQKIWCRYGGNHLAGPQKMPGSYSAAAPPGRYSAYSKQINAIYGRYTDLVEPFSIDESWLDITGSMHLFGGDGKAIADEIRAAVRKETGLTCSVGVSFNKIFAKLGSDYKNRMPPRFFPGLLAGNRIPAAGVVAAVCGKNCFQNAAPVRD